MGRAVVEPRAARAGALEELVERYGRLIKAVIAKVTRGNSVDEDVEQRVVLALWKKIEGEQRIEHPATYIYRCAVREAVRAVRHEQARATEPIDEELPAHAGTEQTLAARELSRTVARCVAALSDERRRAVTAHLSGFSVEEIMEMHGWSYQKARNLIARGMTDLRARLRTEGVDVD